MERITLLNLVEPELGPETLADFSRNMKAVAHIRRSLLDRVDVHKENIKEMQEKINVYLKYFENLNQLMMERPNILMDENISKLHMEYIWACTKHGEIWKKDLSEAIKEETRMLCDLQKELITINEAVEITTPKECENFNTCPICYNDIATHVCSPCGHTYCIKCIEYKNECVYCRSFIERKIKVFYL